MYNLVRDKVEVSVIIPVYNHKNYIGQCIESVLDQRVSFTYDVWIGDDCSTDKTQDELHKLEKKCPSNYHFIYRPKNIHPNNSFDLIRKSNSKYIIMLEGDDYWIDNYKLQKQYDFLENNPDFLAVYHDCKVVDSKSKDLDEIYPRCESDVYTYKDFLHRNLPGQTATCMYRRELFELEQEFIHKYKLYDSFPGDRRKAFILLTCGMTKILPEKMSAYRHVTNKTSSSFSANYVRDNNARLQEVLFYKSIKNYAFDKNNENAYKVASMLYYGAFIRKCFGKNKIL